MASHWLTCNGSHWLGLLLGEEKSFFLLLGWLGRDTSCWECKVDLFLLGSLTGVVVRGSSPFWPPGSISNEVSFIQFHMTGLGVGHMPKSS